MTSAIPDLLRKRAALTPERIALEEDGGRSLTFAAFDLEAARAAAALGAHGIGPGDVAALVCRNRIEAFALLFAAARIGAILAPLNWRMSEPELASAMRASRPRLVIAGREDATRAEAAAATLDLPCLALDGPFGESLRTSAPA